MVATLRRCAGSSEIIQRLPDYMLVRLGNFLGGSRAQTEADIELDQRYEEIREELEGLYPE